MPRLGKLFETGGRRKGYWLVIAENPQTGGCYCLGLDLQMNIISVASYGRHYVDEKRTVETVDLTTLRIEP